MIVTVAQMKQFLRIENELEDDMLEELILQAEQAAEDFCRIKFGEEYPEETPEPVKLACILHAAHFYDNRDSQDDKAYKNMRAAFETLLWPYRNLDTIF